MGHEFSQREKILLVLLILLIVGLVYYKLVLGPIDAKISRITEDTAFEQSEVDTNIAMVARMEQMEKELDELKTSGEKRAIPYYDNSGNVMVELNSILADTLKCSLEFGKAQFDDYLALRPVSISFQTGTYQQARAVLDKMHDSKNINQISDLSLQIGDSYTQVYLTITYFEIVQDK